MTPQNVTTCQPPLVQFCFYCLCVPTYRNRIQFCDRNALSVITHSHWGFIDGIFYYPTWICVGGDEVREWLICQIFWVIGRLATIFHSCWIGPLLFQILTHVIALYTSYCQTCNCFLYLFLLSFLRMNKKHILSSSPVHIDCFIGSRNRNT